MIKIGLMGLWLQRLRVQAPSLTPFLKKEDGVKKLVFFIYCFAVIFSSNAFAGITEDIATAKDDVGYDYGLISKWTSEELSEGIAYSAVGGANRPAEVHGIGSFELGAGATAAIWNVDTNKLRSLPTRTIKTSSLDFKGAMGVPGILLQGKLGLPLDMDLGLKYGGYSFKLDEGNASFDASNTVYGAELRRQFFGKGLSGVALPDISLSLTYDAASGKITSSETYKETTPQSYGGNSYTQILDSTTTGETKWSTQSIGLKAIISKSLIFVTPYAGIAANKNYGNVDTTLTTKGTLTLDGVGASGNLSTSGAGSKSPESFYMRYIAGLDINILLLRLNLNGELADKYYAVGLWTHLSF